MKNVSKIVFAILLLIVGYLCALSGRYEIEPLGRSRDACLLSDNWTGNVKLVNIDYSSFKSTSTDKKQQR